MNKSRIKVLAVDDEPEIIASFHFLFTEMFRGFDFVSAENGASGLELIENEHPDVVLLDLKLGAGIDGIEVLRRSRKLYPSVKIIILTGYFDARLENEAKLIGVDAYLKKPLDNPEEIEKIVRDLVGVQHGS